MGTEIRKFMIMIVILWLIIASTLGLLTYKVLHSVMEKGLQYYVEQIWEGDQKNKNL